MDLDNRLRALRKAAGLTQVALAELTGVSQPTISQLENGTMSMDLQWMRAFARVLGCNPADLLPDKDNPDRLDAQERELVGRFRNADRELRRTVARVVDVLVPDTNNDGTERSA